VKREIQLDGGEITILKTLGLSGAPISGKLFLERLGPVSENELVDTLGGLIDRGFVLSSKVNVVKLDEIEHSFFRVNSAYARELRDAIRPGRRREEERGRRRRRS
jgi:hypothetical protein